MKVYFCTYNHTNKGTSGADIYHHNLAKLFLSWGWEVRSFSNQAKSRYDCEGVLVVPFTDHIHSQLWCDIIITIPNMHTQCRKGKPMFIVKHNIGQEQHRFDKDRIIYCGEAVRQELKMPCLDSFVWNPGNRFAGTELRPKGNYWTLINCNENKGGRLLPQLAELLPDYQFRGVLGAYGTQITSKLPNIEYSPCVEDIQPYYLSAAGLLSFSKFEGFPTVLLEGMAHGLPIIARDIPGVRDACRDSAVYCESVYDMAEAIRAGQFPETVTRANEVEYNRDFEGFKRFLMV